MTARQYVVPYGQHLDDMGRGHGVHLPANLEQQTLRDSSRERQGEPEAGESARLRFDLDLATQPRHRAFDDVEPHPPSGHGVGVETSGKTCLENGG